jgi:hypothetical protein
MRERIRLRPSPFVSPAKGFLEVNLQGPEDQFALGAAILAADADTP